MWNFRPHVRPFAEGGCRNEATELGFEPIAPIGAVDVADIGDRPRLGTRWRGETPAHHSQIAGAIVVERDDRGHGVGIDRRQFELHAVIDMGNSEKADDLVARLANTVEIAHWIPLGRFLFGPKPCDVDQNWNLYGKFSFFPHLASHALL